VKASFNDARLCYMHKAITTVSLKQCSELRMSVEAYHCRRSTVDASRRDEIERLSRRVGLG
jgi:hypothetical protein